MQLGTTLFYFVLGFVVLVTESLVPDARKIQKWKEREQKTWCTTKWVSTNIILHDTILVGRAVVS
jgi:hypothetical protein